MFLYVTCNVDELDAPPSKLEELHLGEETGTARSGQVLDAKSPFFSVNPQMVGA